MTFGPPAPMSGIIGGSERGSDNKKRQVRLGQFKILFDVSSGEDADSVFSKIEKSLREYWGSAVNSVHVDRYRSNGHDGVASITLWLAIGSGRVPDTVIKEEFSQEVAARVDVPDSVCGVTIDPMTSGSVGREVKTEGYAEYTEDRSQIEIY